MPQTVGNFEDFLKKRKPFCDSLLPPLPGPLPYLQSSWTTMPLLHRREPFHVLRGVLFLTLASSAWQRVFLNPRVRYNCSSIPYPGFTHSWKKYLVFLVHGINHRISPNRQNNLNQCFTVWLSTTIPTPRWCFPSSLLLDQMVHVLASLLSFSDHSTLSKDHCRKPDSSPGPVRPVKPHHDLDSLC